MTPTPSLRSEVAGAAARFRGLPGDPERVQRAVLARLLARHAGTEFGRRHGFAAIDSAEAYRDRVPLSTYEALRPSIERMARGERDILVADPVVAFEETGGSSGGAKLVPYTADALDAFRRALVPWLDDLCTTWPGIAAGRHYWSISPACRVTRLTEGGIPVGLPGDAAYFGASLAPHILALLAVPPAVGAVGDIALWRRATLLHLVACADLALVSVWSPTFLLDLLAALVADREAIAGALARGEFGLPVPDALREHLRAPAPDPGRAALLSRVAAAAEPPWRELWPALELVSCWDQAAARPWAGRLRAALPGVAVQGKGLLATEGLVTFPLAGADLPVLALESGFFEFVDAAGRARFAWELEAGADYALVMTNASGLWRHAIGDRVRVGGLLERTPLLEFLGRDGVASDLCGEKLDEAFVAGALRGTPAAFAVLAAEPSARGYALILDAGEVAAEAAGALAARVELALGANPQYAYARRLGQLAPLRPVRLARPLDAWLRRGLARGQRLGDVKPPVLLASRDWPAVFGVEPA